MADEAPMAGAAGGARPESPVERLGPYLQVFQTGVAILSLSGASVVAGRFIYPSARCVERLHPRMRSAGGEVRGLKVAFALNPYDRLTPKRAVILQGRNQEGKTTLLRTSIPWYRRWPLGGYHGIYLNGAKGTGVDSFKEWQTTQMFGNTTTAGSEIDHTLVQYRASQWFRRILEAIKVPLPPKPAFIVVDQFEELLKKYPTQALDWANTLTNQHVRDNLARVIFVVNSDAGAQTLLNLNQGTRFHKVVMEPESGEGVRGLDVDQFKQCKLNIGLYKMIDEKIQGGDLTKDRVDLFVVETFKRWKRDFQVPYPMKYDHTWGDMPEQEIKDKMKETLEAALRAKKKKDGKPEYSEEEVEAWMGSAVRAWRVLNPSQILDAPEEEWARLLEGTGAEPGVAKALASEIKRMIGNPVPHVCVVA